MVNVIGRRFVSLVGNRQKLDGGAMFGNAPKALWQRWMKPDEDNRIDLACRCLLVREGDGRLILLETGVGAFFSPILKERYGVQESHDVLLEQLAKHGIAPEDIDVVILSHLHFDHAGGLLSAWREGEASVLNFPNASYVVSRKAWDRALNPHVRDRASFVPEIMNALMQSSRVFCVDDLQDLPSILPRDYRMHESNGHTPGMLLTEIPMPRGSIVFAADLIPGLSWVHAPITMGYDRFPEQVVDEKICFLEDCVRRNVSLFLTHDPEYDLVQPICDERGRYSARVIDDINSTYFEN
jgi:glyoxylase-like metal-dependent hydrolase (beta-lactamase superfamily II)